MTGYDTFEIYRQWCADHGRPAPTLQWWLEHCNAPFLASYGRKLIEHRDADQREIDRERMEGWAYGYV